MQQLLLDPETLPFKQNKIINLAILKKQINRRVIKIKSMLGYNQIYQRNQVINCGCQTENVQLNEQTYNQIRQSSILSPKKSTLNLPVYSTKKPMKYAGRCSLPVGKVKDRRNQQKDLRKSTRVKVSQYLKTAKAQDNGILLRNTQEKENTINQQPRSSDKQFSNNQSDFYPIRHSKKKSQIYMERGRQDQLNQLQIFRSPDHRNEAQSQSSDLQAVRSNSTAAKGLKKIKFTQRTDLWHQKRYCITEDIIQKMNNNISKLISKKRREAQDNKLRQNIFKKIDQKYGEYFYNI